MTEQGTLVLEDAIIEEEDEEINDMFFYV